MEQLSLVDFKEFVRQLEATEENEEETKVDADCDGLIRLEIPQLDKRALVTLNQALNLLPFSLHLQARGTAGASPVPPKHSLVVLGRRPGLAGTVEGGLPVEPLVGADTMSVAVQRQAKQRAMLHHLLACNNTIGGAYATLNYTARWASGSKRSEKWLRKQLYHADRQLAIAYALNDRGLALRALIFRGYSLIWRKQHERAVHYFRFLRTLIRDVETIASERDELFGMIVHAELVNELEKKHGGGDGQDTSQQANGNGTVS